MLADQGRGPLWFQLYLQHDRGFTRELVQRAEHAGYEVLALTVDAFSSGSRDRARCAGFVLSRHVSAGNLENMRGSLRQPLQPDQSAMFDVLLNNVPVWSDVEWLQAQTSLPVLPKGTLHEDDVRQAPRLNVASATVSNHGGRTLDTVPATAWVLPGIVDAVNGAMPILVDGGIRRGTDVFKAMAMALGPSAVLVGLPCVHVLANAGALGGNGLYGVRNP